MAKSIPRDLAAYVEPTPPAAAIVPLEIELRVIPFCVCGCTDIVHSGPKGRDSCLIHPDCEGFRDADAA